VPGIGNSTEHSVADGVGVIELAFLLGPPGAAALCFTMRILARRLLPWMCIFAMAYIAIIILATVMGLQFTTLTANYTCGALAWTAWCFCCACGLWAKAEVVRATFLMVALVTVGLSYCSAGLTVMAFLNAPEKPERTFETPELTCEFTPSGGIGTSSGYTVVLYRKLTVVPWLPLQLPQLRLELNQAKVNETASEPDLSCGDLDDRFSRADTGLYSPINRPAN
jgi:hypothetical protein